MERKRLYIHTLQALRIIVTAVQRMGREMGVGWNGCVGKRAEGEDELMQHNNRTHSVMGMTCGTVGGGGGE